MVLAGAAPAVAGALQPVTLEIVNDEPATALRCVVMLAHFVSVEAGPIAPGGSLSLPLGRGADDASLTLANAAGKPMMIENVVCGASVNWAATRADVSLLALRAPATRRLAMRCRIDGRLGCRGVASAE